MQKMCKRCEGPSERYADGRCITCVKLRNAAWAVANRDDKNARARQWTEANREKRRAIGQGYRERNREAIRARRKQLRAQNPGREARWKSQRRAQKKGSTGTLSANIVEVLLRAQRGCCACCGEPLNGVFHLDHKTPLSRGGFNVDENVQLLLPACNLQKYTLSHEEFVRTRRRFP